MGLTLRGLLPFDLCYVFSFRARHARGLNSFGSSLPLDLVIGLRISYLAWKVSTDGFCFRFAFGLPVSLWILPAAPAMRSGCYVTVATIQGYVNFQARWGTPMKQPQIERDSR